MKGRQVQLDIRQLKVKLGFLKSCVQLMGGTFSIPIFDTFFTIPVTLSKQMFGDNSFNQAFRSQQIFDYISIFNCKAYIHPLVFHGYNKNSI